MSKAPFLAARAQTISGKNRYMVVMVREAWHAVVHGVTESDMTE